MKRLAAILLGAALLFMAMSMLEEWEIFKPLLTGKRVAQPARTCPEEARKTLDVFNTLLTHLYWYGDERFLDRLPAADRVKASVAEDLEYLERNGIIQVMTQRAFKVLEQKSLPDGACEFWTEEEWALHYESPDGRRFSEKDKTFAIVWRYVIRKAVGGWEVAMMEPAHGQ